MRFQYRYFGHSGAQHTADSTALQFAPDTLRAPVHFVADINRHLPFREGMSALHDVVVGDLRFQPRDKSAYLEWLAGQEGELLAQFMTRSDELKAQMAPLRDELADLRKRKSAVLQPFMRAQKSYFDHIYKVNREAWFVLDPVITVHPDRVFFECFSQDESSYGMFSCSHDVFDRVSDHAFGTTTSTTRSRCTTSSRRSATTRPRAWPSTPAASRCKATTTRPSTSRRSTCPTAGCAASCR
ncbi:hypothetical protein [Variovorax sp. E3]|uniref:hypothetical protein n=1 Tax=Variovorax sp. E3 TaxID=1914993 RepID=UPI0018DB2880|nr:hypothetical protein [Variovorax sp. E3]